MDDLGTSTATLPRPERPPEPVWENIPEALTVLLRWILWGHRFVKGKWTKIPLQIDGEPASSTDPTTWAPFEHVQCAYLADAITREPQFDGVGFVFNGDGIVGLDFDHCIGPDGEIDPTIAGYIERLDSYPELSPSGTGVHVLAFGRLPGPHRKFGRCELYETERYFTVTGMTLGAPKIGHRQEALEVVYLDVFAERIAKRNVAAHASANGNRNGASPISSLDDAQLVDRARKAKNGERFTALYDRGDRSVQGFPSQSEADLALCSMLAFWCSRDAGRIDALFRGSALMRDKWLRDDYRERTLSEAIAGCRETFGEGSAGATGNGVARANSSADAQRAEQTVEGHEPQPPTPYSEIALSNRFAESRGRDFHYAGGSWWHYDEAGGLWLRDETLRVFTEVKRFNTGIAREVCDAAAGDEDASKAARKFASELTAAKKVAAVENLTRSHSATVITLDRFDRDIWTLNTPGGVVELREGTIRPTRRDDLFTKSTPVAPRDIPTPMFDRFLREIMGAHVPPAICKCAACTASVGGPDEERQALHDAEIQSLVDYLLRLYGYCLSGDISNHILVILLGDGGNGKTQLTDFVAQDILGPAPTGYSASLPIEALLAHKTDRHPTELMSLFHTRLALASEPSSGVSWNEGLVMRLTGGEPVTARAMRQDFITFAATHKLFVVGNTAPALRGGREPAWQRRLQMILFQQRWADRADPGNHVRLADANLREKLRPEAPGVLHKLILGCLDYVRRGTLDAPPTIRAISDSYLKQQNVVGRWLDERCDRSNPHATLTVAELWADLTRWGETSREYIGKRNDFNGALERLGIKITRTDSQRGICLGVALLPFGEGAS